MKEVVRKCVYLSFKGISCHRCLVKNRLALVIRPRKMVELTGCYYIGEELVNWYGNKVQKSSKIVKVITP